MSGTQPRPTKSQRREEARLQAQRMREEQARKERRSRIIAISLIVVAVVAIVLVVAIILGNQKPSSSGQSLGDVANPAGATSTGGLAFDEDGLVGLTGDGKADVPDGTTHVEVYSDYMCPNCGQFEKLNSDMLDGMLQDGTIVYDYHLVSILDRLSNGTEFSTRSANAAATVADQDPEHFIAFHEALFAQQPEENSDGLSDDRIASIARDAGVPEDVVKKFGD